MCLDEVHAVRKHKQFGRAIALVCSMLRPIRFILTDSARLYASADHLNSEVATGGPQNETVSKQRSLLLSGCLSEQFSVLGKRTEQIQKNLRVCPSMDAGRDPKSCVWQMVPGDMSQDVG